MSDDEYDYSPTVECRDFYVYLHRTEDGTPFYVGKGRGLRAYSKAGRSHAWRAFASGCSYSVEILRVGMTDGEARALETDTIVQIGQTVDGSGPLINAVENDTGFLWRQYYVVEDEIEILAKWHRDGCPV